MSEHNLNLICLITDTIIVPHGISSSLTVMSRKFDLQRIFFGGSFSLLATIHNSALLVSSLQLILMKGNQHVSKVQKGHIVHMSILSHGQKYGHEIVDVFL